MTTELYYITGGPARHQQVKPKTWRILRHSMESHSGQKGIEFPKRYQVAKIVYQVALKRQNDTENRGKTSRVLCFQKYHIEMTQNNMSRIYNKNNLSRISH